MQQQSEQNQQQVMPQPPNVVTTKDEIYITDMLSWNLLAAKKSHYFAQQCTDTDVKSALESVSQMHVRHYQQILSHLQSNNQPIQPTQ
ncbi:hypothetical protein ACFPU1_00290 [Thalassorhabdus alkalitolerans]|uniref:Coat F domain-containing protein n=1 Tax=Thalassorhabdus alkalitolerans TaxID=2282697 RepID=A0ABW0YFK6_9BACI|nr:MULTISPECIES: hypothetical protein [Bacillaceae]